MLPAATVAQLVDAIAVLLGQAYQLARIRLASAASPVLRLLIQRDHAISEMELLRRELEILRASRQSMPPHRRPDYQPAQRLAILQLRRLRGWSIAKTADRLVLHPNTIRSWIKAAQGCGNLSLFTGAILWNRLDDVVRFAAHELRRFCPEVEFGSRSIARHLLRAGIEISRSTVQRILREPRPHRPRRKPPMAAALGIQPKNLLLPKRSNHVWHMDLTCLRILWVRFTLAAILDGFSRKLLCIRVYRKTPRSADAASLVRLAVQEHGKPRFLITDHGTQFRKQFHHAMTRSGIRHVRARVRAPYLNGRMERFFRTFRVWWSLVLCGLSLHGIQKRLDTYHHWYNHHRPHSALGNLTPEEAWANQHLSEPVAIRARDPTPRPRIDVQRLPCGGDPRLPVIQIIVRRAA